MTRYLLIASYTPEGAEALLGSGGSARRSAVEKFVADLGGQVESFDFAFGGEDAYVIVDLPGNAAAAALALAASATGQVSLRTVVLITPEEVDEAARYQVTYTPAAMRGLHMESGALGLSDS